MSCACKTISELFDGCVGQVAPCEGRCRPLRSISTGREAQVPSCWDKTAISEEAPCQTA